MIPMMNARQDLYVERTVAQVPLIMTSAEMPQTANIPTVNALEMEISAPLNIHAGKMRETVIKISIARQDLYVERTIAQVILAFQAQLIVALVSTQYLKSYQYFVF